jgi:hypothetical protein
MIYDVKDRVDRLFSTPRPQHDFTREISNDVWTPVWRQIVVINNEVLLRIQLEESDDDSE